MPSVPLYSSSNHPYPATRNAWQTSIHPLRPNSEASGSRWQIKHTIPFSIKITRKNKIAEEYIFKRKTGAIYWQTRKKSKILRRSKAGDIKLKEKEKQFKVNRGSQGLPRGALRKIQAGMGHEDSHRSTESTAWSCCNFGGLSLPSSIK